jgi:hypothetical protein
MQNFEVSFLLLDNEPISGSHLSSFLHILPLKQINGKKKKVRNHKLFYRKCLWISYFFQIYYFISSSVIYLFFARSPYGLTRGNSGLVLSALKLFDFEKFTFKKTCSRNVLPRPSNDLYTSSIVSICRVDSGTVHLHVNCVMMGPIRTLSKLINK